MHQHHRTRRLPVEHRGQRVSNLYKRPKPSGDSREGDTYEVIFRDESGAQRQKTLRARSVQRAIAESEEYRTQVRRGELAPPSKLTFGEVAEEYLQQMEALVASGGRSQRTVDLYRQRNDSYLSGPLGSKRIQEVRAEQVAGIFASQRKAGRAEWTIHGTRVVLSGVFSFALSRGYVAANPLHRLAKIDKPRQVARREPRRLTEDEVRRLCEAATPRYKPVVTTLAWTGLRVGEALALEWADIDFDAREIHVRQQLVEKGGVKPPKTKAGKRSVPMLPVVENVLKEHRKAQFALGLAGPEHHVFLTATGQTLNRHNVREKGVKAAATKAGLHPKGATKVATHDLRRTFLSHLIIGIGLDPVQAARIAGHTNPSVTLNIYADEFDRTQHRDDLRAKIEQAGFGAV